MFFPTYRAAAHRALRAITFNGLLKIQSRFLTYLDMLHCVCMCQLLRAQKQHTHTHRITQCAKVMTRHQITTRNNTFQRSHICDGTHTQQPRSPSRHFYCYYFCTVSLLLGGGATYRICWPIHTLYIGVKGVRNLANAGCDCCKLNSSVQTHITCTKGQ